MQFGFDREERTSRAIWARSWLLCFFWHCPLQLAFLFWDTLLKLCLTKSTLVRLSCRYMFLPYDADYSLQTRKKGGFASKYITGNYFMDVHPPLGKLLITLAGFLSGFDGVFDFKEIGKSYIGKFVPYTSMRLLSASLGLLIPIIGFRTVRNFGYSLTAATITGLLLVFDNALTLYVYFASLKLGLIGQRHIFG